MAVYFDLTPRVDPGHGPMTLQDIDVAICAYLGIEVHAKLWARQWYDVIGFQLACGKSWEQIDRMLCEWLLKDRQGDNASQTQWDADLLLISHWMQDNYIPNCGWMR